MSKLTQNTTDLQAILEVANKINTDVTTQTDIISQIATALEGKAAGSGGGASVETCSVSINGIRDFSNANFVYTSYNETSGMVTVNEVPGAVTSIELTNVVCNTPIVYLNRGNIYSASMGDTITQHFASIGSVTDEMGSVVIYSASGNGQISISNGIPSPEWD